MFTPIALLKQGTFTFDEFNYPFFYRWSLLGEDGHPRGQLEFRRFDEFPRQEGNDLTAGDLLDNGYLTVVVPALTHKFVSPHAYCNIAVV